ncbi:MAG: XRE family transcriptional regulator, partial [Oenococcus sp.]
MVFDGRQLRVFRESCHTSVVDFAAKMNIGLSTIQKYELNLKIPDFFFWNRMNSIFGVGQVFFEDQADSSDGFEENSIAFRSKVVSHTKETNDEVSFLNQSNSLILKLSDGILFPHRIIFELRDQIQRMVLDGAKIEELADFARRELNIDNQNNNLMVSIENSGVNVIEHGLSDKFDAYSAWSKRNVPYIVLGNLYESNFRRNFDLAHELGHLLLHYGKNFSLDDTQTRALEKEANQFASIFLMPEQEFVQLFHEYVHFPSDPNDYIGLKSKIQVSIVAIAMRAYKLDLISDKQYKSFFINVSMNKYRLEEPLDHDKHFPLIRPGKIRAIIETRVSSENNYSTDSFLSKYGVNTSYVSRTFNLELENDTQVAYTAHLAKVINLN